MLYFGPETMMPLASAAAAVAGVLLMFWHRVVGFTRMTVRRLLHPRVGKGMGGERSSSDRE